MCVCSVHAVCVAVCVCVSESVPSSVLLCCFTDRQLLYRSAFPDLRSDTFGVRRVRGPAARGASACGAQELRLRRLRGRILRQRRRHGARSVGRTRVLLGCDLHLMSGHITVVPVCGACLRAVLDDAVSCCAVARQFAFFNICRVSFLWFNSTLKSLYRGPGWAWLASPPYPSPPDLTSAPRQDWCAYAFRHTHTHTHETCQTQIRYIRTFYTHTFRMLHWLHAHTSHADTHCICCFIVCATSHTLTIAVAISAEELRCVR